MASSLAERGVGVSRVQQPCMHHVQLTPPPTHTLLLLPPRIVCSLEVGPRPRLRRAQVGRRGQLQSDWWLSGEHPCMRCAAPSNCLPVPFLRVHAVLCNLCPRVFATSPRRQCQQQQQCERGGSHEGSAGQHCARDARERAGGAPQQQEGNEQWQRHNSVNALGSEHPQNPSQCCSCGCWCWCWCWWCCCCW